MRRTQSAAQRRARRSSTSFADWVNDEAMRTRARWPSRNPEIAIIAGAALVLMLLAIGAGASLWGVFISVGLLSPRSGRRGASLRRQILTRPTDGLADRHD